MDRRGKKEEADTFPAEQLGGERPLVGTLDFEKERPACAVGAAAPGPGGIQKSQAAPLRRFVFPPGGKHGFRSTWPSGDHLAGSKAGQAIPRKTACSTRKGGPWQKRARVQERWKVQGAHSRTRDRRPSAPAVLVLRGPGLSPLLALEGVPLSLQHQVRPGARSAHFTDEEIEDPRTTWP